MEPFRQGPNRCSVPQCRSVTRHGISFYELSPKFINWRKWIINCGFSVADIHSKVKTLVCALHFEINNFETDRRKLKLDSFPTMYLPPSPIEYFILENFVDKSKQIVDETLFGENEPLDKLKMKLHLSLLHFEVNENFVKMIETLENSNSDQDFIELGDQIFEFSNNIQLCIRSLRDSDLITQRYFDKCWRGRFPWNKAMAKFYHFEEYFDNMDNVLELNKSNGDETPKSSQQTDTIEVVSKSSESIVPIVQTLPKKVSVGKKRRKKRIVDPVSLKVHDQNNHRHYGKSNRSTPNTTLIEFRVPPTEQPLNTNAEIIIDVVDGNEGSHKTIENSNMEVVDDDLIEIIVPIPLICIEDDEEEDNAAKNQLPKPGHEYTINELITNFCQPLSVSLEKKHQAIHRINNYLSKYETFRSNIIRHLPIPPKRCNSRKALVEFIPKLIRIAERHEDRAAIMPPKPKWWPDLLPYCDEFHTDRRSEEQKAKINYVHCLRQIVRNCYRYYNSEYLLSSAKRFVVLKHDDDGSLNRSNQNTLCSESDSFETPPTARKRKITEELEDDELPMTTVIDIVESRSNSPTQFSQSGSSDGNIFINYDFMNPPTSSTTTSNYNFLRTQSIIDNVVQNIYLQTSNYDANN